MSGVKLTTINEEQSTKDKSRRDDYTTIYELTTVYHFTIHEYTNIDNKDEPWIESSDAWGDLETCHFWPHLHYTAYVVQLS